MAAKQPLPAVLIASLPWRTAARDRREVRKVLDEAQIDTLGPLGRELFDMLSARVVECRDLFVLRGVRPKRHSVLQLAGRSLAADAAQVARLDLLAGGHGRALLSLLSNLIELRSGHAARPQPKAPARAVPVPTGAVARRGAPTSKAVVSYQAANDEFALDLALQLAA